MNRNILAILAAAVLAIVVLAAIQTSNDNTGGVEIGAIFPLSGDGASYGKALQNGVNLFLAQQRKRGKVSISVKYEDTRLDPGAAVSAFRKLVSVDGVPVVLGPFSSSQMLAVGPVAQQQKRVLISATATSPKISSLGDFVFRIIPSDTYDGRVVAHLIRQQLPKAHRVILVRINNDYGSGIQHAFSKECSAVGLSISKTFLFQPGATDFRVLVRQIKELAPDVIFLVGYKEMGRFLRQAKEAALHVPIVSTGLMEDPEIVKIAQGGAEGVMYSYPSFNPRSGRQIVSAFVKAFKAKFGSDPDVIAALGYDLAHLVNTVVAESRDETPQAIRDRLFKVKKFPGVAGDITFDKNGDVVKPSGVKVIKNGKFVWVDETLSLPKE